MNPVRSLALALGLVGVFLLSAAVGGLIARQLHSTAGPAVAEASPTPFSTVVPTSTPTISATPEATASPVPPPTPSLVPTLVPTLGPTPTPALDPPTVEEFATDLSAAIRGGNTDYLNARLHQATLDRYGGRACRQYIVNTIAGKDVTWEILSVSGPAEWVYETDGIQTVIPDAWTVSVRQPGATPELRDLHFAPVDGTWRWFTDCTPNP